MSYRNNPAIQAKIQQNRFKKDQLINSTARSNYLRGARMAAKAAQELISEGYDDTFDFQSLVLHRMKLISAAHLKKRDVADPPETEQKV